MSNIKESLASTVGDAKATIVLSEVRESILGTNSEGLIIWLYGGKNTGKTYFSNSISNAINHLGLDVTFVSSGYTPRKEFKKDFLFMDYTRGKFDKKMFRDLKTFKKHGSLIIVTSNSPAPTELGDSVTPILMGVKPSVLYKDDPKETVKAIFNLN